MDYNCKCCDKTIKLKTKKSFQISYTCSIGEIFSNKLRYEKSFENQKCFELDEISNEYMTK